MFHGEQFSPSSDKKKIVPRGTIFFSLCISELLNFNAPIVGVGNSTILNVLQRLIKVE